MFWYKFVVEVPVPVPVEASVARPVASSPTPAIHLGYGETMASICQGVVGEAHCISGGGGSRADVGTHRHLPSCSCRPSPPERLGLVVCCS